VEFEKVYTRLCDGGGGEVKIYFGETEGGKIWEKGGEVQ